MIRRVIKELSDNGLLILMLLSVLGIGVAMGLDIIFKIITRN